jgi:hypothetical protein
VAYCPFVEGTACGLGLTKSWGQGRNRRGTDGQFAYRKYFTEYIAAENRVRQEHGCLVERSMLITEELSAADQDVKQYFFSLSPSEIRNILEEYCAQFGADARNYANSTIEKWRVSTVRMSGMVAARLLKLLPPRMPLSEKYRLIENLWNHVGPSSRNTLYVGPDTSIDQVVEIVRSHIDKAVAEYRVPESLEQRFEWLAEGDPQVKRDFLNYLRNHEKLLVEIATRVQLPVMLNHLRGEDGSLMQQLKQVLRIGKREVFRIGKHEVELVPDKRTILRAVIFNAFQQLKQVLRVAKHEIELIWDKRTILRTVIFNAFQQLKQVLRIAKHEIELIWDKRAILRAVIFNAFQKKSPAFWRWALGLPLLLALATYPAARIFQPAERSSAPVYTGPEPFPPPVNLSLPNTAMRPPPPTVLPDVRSSSQSTPEGSSATVKTEVPTPPQLPPVGAPIASDSQSGAPPKPLPEKQTSASTSGPDSPDAPVIAHLDFVGTWGLKNCREPFSISASRAQGYGGRKCEFIQTTQETVNTWHVPADCSRGVERWKANIKLTLNGNKLIWSSERGTFTYVRCSQRAASR